VITFVSREINGFVWVLNLFKKLIIRLFISVTGGGVNESWRDRAGLEDRPEVASA
jgi:hypothetical protein